MTVPFMPLDPRGTVLGDEVYARLGEAILDGQLAPGERLRDHELAERLGVSRTPVREALQRLERTGLVEVAPNRYTRVTTPNDKVQADVFEFVVYLMGFAVRMAVARCSDDVLDDVLIDADEMIAASRSDDHRGLARSSHVFFTKITRASGNVAIIRFLREAEIAIRRTLPGWHPFIECPVGRTAAYESFRDAVATRNGGHAEALLRDIHGFSLISTTRYGEAVGHIELRDLDDDDLDAVFEMMRDQESVAMAAFTAENPGDRDAFDSWVARQRANVQVSYLVVTENGGFAGTIGAFTVDGDREVTYWLARHAWGRGIATEALRLLISREPERPLYARAAAHNAGSIAVLRKSGFTEVSRDVAYAPGVGREVEEIVFTLVPALDGS